MTVLTETFEIVGAVSWHVVVAGTFTFRYFTMWLFIFGIHIFMLLVAVITETFGGRTYHFTINTFFIAPGCVDTIFGIFT